MPVIPHQKCANCYFYDKLNASTGLCRTVAPSPANNAGGPLVVTWPTVQGATDWCGRWAPAPS